MNKELVGAVIVTYNPTENLLDSINIIKDQVGKIVIVDNNSNNKDYVESVSDSNVECIFNSFNKGIADALNIGCKCLLNSGFKYGLLLDQDSILNENAVEYLVQTLSDDSNCGLAGPQVVLKIDGELKDTNYLVNKGVLFKKIYANGKPLNVLINITSGSLIKLDIWNEIGGFFGELFIEGVDDEYCLRLKTKGYSVKIDDRAKLYQEYGNQTKVMKFGKTWYPTHHSPIRIYYLYRNKMLIMKRYFFKQPAYNIFQVLSLIKRGITIGVSETQRKQKMKAAFVGLFDGVCGERGVANVRKQKQIE